MPVRRPFILPIVSAVATIGLLLVAAPQVAAAATGSPSAPATITLTGSPDAVSPSGCVQRADYPHASTHVPNTTNGVVTTRCNAYVPKIAHSAQLWETRWWGWDRIGHKGYVSVIDSKGASANGWDTCKKNTVRVTGSGSVVDVDGRTYYASTESIHVNNPCHL
ncbi:MAG TPA: hypothetical protein VIK61_13105 [Acidimicrobiia bacterium]